MYLFIVCGVLSWQLHAMSYVAVCDSMVKVKSNIVTALLFFCFCHEIML